MISVILPVYRVEKYINACVQSVLQQTYREYEVIVVDDGSPDHSAAIAEALLQADGTVPYQIIHTENRGVSAARNTGVDKARGEYVVMVDSDDVVSPDFLAEYVQMLEQKPDLDLYSCGFSVVEENAFQQFDKTCADRQLLQWDQAQMVFLERKIRFLLPTLLISRKFLTENGIRFDEAVRYSEDVQFIWRCLAYNRKGIYHSGKKLYNYILHPGSTMTASGIPKILTCCDGMNRLLDQVGDKFCPYVKKQLAMRTWFAMLHGAAKMMDRQSFCRLYAQAQSDTYIRQQARNGGLIVRTVSAALLISRPLGYRIMRKF